jgi:hypothetical protein
MTDLSGGGAEELSGDEARLPIAPAQLDLFGETLLLLIPR